MTGNGVMSFISLVQHGYLLKSKIQYTSYKTAYIIFAFKILPDDINLPNTKLLQLFTLKNQDTTIKSIVPVRSVQVIRSKVRNHRKCMQHPQLTANSIIIFLYTIIKPTLIKPMETCSSLLATRSVSIQTNTNTEKICQQIINTCFLQMYAELVIQCDVFLKSIF